MTTPEPVDKVLWPGREDNPASWRWMIAFYEHILGLPVPVFQIFLPFQSCLPLLHLVEYLATTETAQRFRAGQSLHDLLISTKAYNGLDVDDPFIRVAAEWHTPNIRVEYWLGHEAGDMAEQHTVEGPVVAPSQIMEFLTPLLARLRSETQGQSE